MVWITDLPFFISHSMRRHVENISKIEAFTALIEDPACRHVAILTGAGVSAESGIPTFRGEGGLWRTHRAQDVATTTAFKKDPAQVWEVCSSLSAAACFDFILPE